MPGALQRLLGDGKEEELQRAVRGRATLKLSPLQFIVAAYPQTKLFKSVTFYSEAVNLFLKKFKRDVTIMVFLHGQMFESNFGSRKNS